MIDPGPHVKGGGKKNTRRFFFPSRKEYSSPPSSYDDYRGGDGPDKSRMEGVAGCKVQAKERVCGRLPDRTAFVDHTAALLL